MVVFVNRYSSMADKGCPNSKRILSRSNVKIFPGDSFKKVLLSIDNKANLTWFIIRLSCARGVEFSQEG